MSVSLEATASGQGGRYITVTMEATDSDQEGHVFLVDVGDFFVKQLKTGERDKILILCREPNEKFLLC